MKKPGTTQISIRYIDDKRSWRTGMMSKLYFDHIRPVAVIAKEEYAFHKISQRRQCVNEATRVLKVLSLKYAEMTSLDHIEDLPTCCGTEMFSTGLLISAIFARLIPHLNVGAQKKTVCSCS